VEIRREIAARELAEEKAEIKRRLTMSKAMQERERAKRRLERDAANMVTHEGHRTPEGPFGETRPDARIAAAKPILSAEEVAAAEAAEAAAAAAKEEQDLRTMSGRRRPETPGKVQLLVPSEREAKGKLVVQLRDGSGLRAADKAKLGREASSDPYAARAILWPAIRSDSHVSRPATPLYRYVKFKLGGTWHKSKVIKRSLEPDWKDERFEFRGTIGSLAQETLVVEVFDHDAMSFNDSLGEAKVPLAALLRRGLNEELTLYLKGEATKHRPEATGHVRIVLSWDD